MLRARQILDGGTKIRLDITYLRPPKAFLHLAFVLDLYSRRIVGWSMAVRLRTKLVVDAVEMEV